MTNCLVSIIIPVYNTPKNYLKECLDSVINQTYNNIEIIIVDDGSEIEIAKFLDSYCRNIENIKLIHKINEGVSVARNVGVSISNGDWITFVDSDDYLNIDGISQLINESSGYDFVVGNTVTFTQKDEIFINASNEKVIIDDSNKEDLYHSVFLAKKGSLGNIIGPFCKLYKSKIVKNNKIQFLKKLPHGEDLIFNIEYFKYIEKGLLLKNDIYFYRKDNFLSVTSKYDSKLSYKRHLLIDELNSQYCDVVYEYKDDYYDFLLFMLKTDLSKQIFHKNHKVSYKDKIIELKSIIEDNYYNECIRNVKINTLGLGRKVLVIILRLRLYFLLPLYSKFVN